LRARSPFEARVEQIQTKGFLYQGWWVRSKVRIPFVVKVEEGAEGTEQSPIEVRKDEAMSEDFAHNACNGVTENDMRLTKISTGIKITLSALGTVYRP
jgi:hypothetical protein